MDWILIFPGVLHADNARTAQLVTMDWILIFPRIALFCRSLIIDRHILGCELPMPLLERLCAELDRDGRRADHG